MCAEDVSWVSEEDSKNVNLELFLPRLTNLLAVGTSAG